MRNVLTVLLAIAIGLTAVPTNALAGTLADAQARANERGVPLVVDFYTDWCSWCKVFDKDRETNADLQASLSQVEFVQIDAERGEGIELAKQYQVRGFPNYVAMDAAGDVIHHWIGYAGPEHFMDNVQDAVDDPAPFAKKVERFETSPTFADAIRISEVYATRGQLVDAVDHLRKGQELGPDGTDHSVAILDLMAQGLRTEEFTVNQVSAQADAVVARTGATPEDLASVASTARYLSKAAGDKDIYVKYLKPAVAALETNEALRAKHKGLMIDHALLVEKNGGKAVKLKYASMPEGWQEDSARLNSYAWWCFENGLDLERAESLARKGAEVAESGSERAMVLDTAAEICNALGNCNDAVTLIQRAIEENPEEKYYQEQLARFEKLLQSSGR